MNGYTPYVMTTAPLGRDFGRAAVDLALLLDHNGLENVRGGVAMLARMVSMVFVLMLMVVGAMVTPIGPGGQGVCLRHASGESLGSGHYALAGGD
jgi:hypothetical protein